MVETVYTIVCRIIGEHGTSRDTLLTMFRDATTAARMGEKLTVRVHPDDAAVLADQVTADVRFMADSSVTLGGCVIDSVSGSLDARFETQLAMLGARFLERRAQHCQLSFKARVQRAADAVYDTTAQGN